MYSPNYTWVPMVVCCKSARPLVDVVPMETNGSEGWMVAACNSARPQVDVVPSAQDTAPPLIRLVTKGEGE